MSSFVKFTINNQVYLAKKGETVLDVALREGIDIPHLCKHPDLSVKANCRTCIVEVKDIGIATACSTQIEQGMKVKTDTLKVKRARKINLELIFSEHIEKCNQCLYQDNCILLKYAKKYDLKICRFEDRKRNYPIWQFSDSIQFDSSKCIDCRNCVEVCQEKQTCNFYEIAERGVETVVRPKGAHSCHPEPFGNTQGRLVSGSHVQNQGMPKLIPNLIGDKVRHDNKNNVDLLKNDPDKFDCTYCGQCIVHCPVGAISGVPHWQDVEKLLENRQANIVKSGQNLGNRAQILIAQIAPSIRVSIGEEFGLEPGKIVTGQLAASIKKLGFDYVFDVNLGADLTTYEEAKELIHWLNSGKERPMFTSCCPAWVKFIEFYYPEFISHLTTTKPPQICSGTLIKTYFADYLKKDPRDIIVVSIMPCTAKKHEKNLERYKIDLGWCIERLGLNNIEKTCQNRKELQGTKILPVDHVLTTREYAYLLHRHKIDLPSLKPEELDKPLGIYSGAGAVYGATGGVMESALRSADYFFRVLDGKDMNISQKRIDFRQVRGMDGIKTANVDIAGRKLKVAIVNGLGNARKILDDLQNKKIIYDYVEVMACPGGCIGGGGQPILINSEIRAKRANSIYEISKNLPIRTAHENPSVLEIYKNYFKGDEDLIEKMLHSEFKVSKREGYIIK